MKSINAMELFQVSDLKPPSFRDIKPTIETSLNEIKSFWDMVCKGEHFKEDYSKDKRDEITSEVDNSQEIKTDEDQSIIEKPKPIIRNIITLNESLENDRHPMTGVEFKRKEITLPDGEMVEGVFPEFEAIFEAQLPENMLLVSDKNQFKECNRQLFDALEKDANLKEQFTSEQLEQIQDGVFDGTAPDGYVWHHDAEVGRMQLVDAETHARTGHTGGRFLWGGGSSNR